MIGGLGLAICVGFIGIALATNDPAYDDEIAMFAAVFGLLSIAYFIPMLVGGVGLLKRWPWARGVIWMESAMLALAVPVGTLIAGFNLWALLSTREVSADGGMAKFEAGVRRVVPLIGAALVAWFILGVIVGIGYLFRDVIDPPRHQELTPMPSGVPDMSDMPRFEPPSFQRPPAQ